MPKQKTPKDPGEIRANELLAKGADQLATEIEDLLQKEATLLVKFIEHRMVQESSTFDEAAVELGRLALRLHTGATLIRAGYAIENDIAEHMRDSEDA